MFLAEHLFTVNINAVSDSTPIRVDFQFSHHKQTRAVLEVIPVIPG
jgi:hypothetical protein